MPEIKLNRAARRQMARRQALNTAPQLGKCPNHNANVVVSWRPIYHPDTLPDGRRNPDGGRIARYIADRFMCVRCGMVSVSLSEHVIDADREDIEDARRNAIAEAAGAGKEKPTADKADGESGEGVAS